MLNLTVSFENAQNKKTFVFYTAQGEAHRFQFWQFRKILLRLYVIELLKILMKKCIKKTITEETDSVKHKPTEFTKDME